LENNHKDISKKDIVDRNRFILGVLFGWFWMIWIYRAFYITKKKMGLMRQGGLSQHDVCGNATGGQRQNQGEFGWGGETVRKNPVASKENRIKRWITDPSLGSKSHQHKTNLVSSCWFFFPHSVK